ncbi:hypothetical protein I5F77_18655, partial [Pseudomonas aeruginosa]|nr:hypothetical protein [Pseudomonas aeruginosa]
MSSPASICITVTPLSASPASTARWIGAAPPPRGPPPRYINPPPPRSLPAPPPPPPPPPPASMARLYDALHDPQSKEKLCWETDTGNGGYTHKFFR